MNTDMDPGTENGSLSEDGAVSFSRVCAVATGWMFDFVFVSLCRHFKNGEREDFCNLIKTLKDLSQTPCLKDYQECDEKTLICAFLSRVLYGQDLDVLFEDDESVFPLMSAFKIWSSLEQAVEDRTLFKRITTLLLVQSVDVCLKKGNQSSASSVLTWIKGTQECPQSLQMKLSAMAAQRDACHHFRTSNSFSCLLETIGTFLDDYLKRKPSDYLLKAATAAVVSTEDMKEDVESQDSPTSETTPKSNTSKANKRTKRKLLSNKITDLWKPDSCKKLSISIRRLPVNESCDRKFESSEEAFIVQKKKTVRRKWTAKLDTYLKDGVKRHGVGKWGLMLLDYDFEGRTGTMLKDRWRTLLKLQQVG